MLLTARAKINWTLDVLGRRDDGYHRMDMLMSAVELADTLQIEPADTLTLADSLGFDNNLVLKAAKALGDATGCALGAAMRLTKRIPVGAGMGGGSADAAAALVGLNRLWGLDLPTERLREIALAVGADVPFLLDGGFARVGGIGEEIAPLPSIGAIPLVIVQPCGGLSTKEIFTLYDACGDVRHPDTDAAVDALQARDFASFAVAAGNVLQQVSERERPQIAEAQAALLAVGAFASLMTGSGSAVYGAFASKDEAAQAYRALRKRWKRTWLTETSDRGATE